jgi:hypothetical protein
MKAKASMTLCLLLVAVLFLSPARLVNAVSTLTPTSAISSITVPAKMAYDSGKGEIFGQYGDEMSGNAFVEVISDSTNQAVATIAEGPSCAGFSCYTGDVVYDSGRGLVFTAYGAQEVAVGVAPLFSVISDSNNSLVATISWNTPGNSQYNWPFQPTAMVYDPGKGEIFVSDIHDGNIFVISDTTYAIVANIVVHASAGEMAYDSARGEVFVANYYQVSAINDSTNKVVANISVSATSLAYDPAKGEVFAYNGNSVAVISDSTNEVVTTISGIAQGPSTIAYDPAKGEIFAGPVISDSTNAAVTQLPLGMGCIVYDSGRGEILAATSTGIDVFSDSASTSTSTTTSTSATSTPTSYTTSTTSSSSSSGGGGGVPEFPYQLSAVVAITVLVAASYLLVRSWTTSNGRPGADE